MARKQSSKFGATDDLFNFSNSNNKEQEVQKVQEVEKEENKERIISEKNNIEKRVPITKYGTTQGKKGMKMKRINMGFSDDIHYYIHHESRKRGISASRFVNEIIEEYMKKNPYIY